MAFLENLLLTEYVWTRFEIPSVHLGSPVEILPLNVQQTGLSDLLYVSGQQFDHEGRGYDKKNPDDKKQIVHFFVRVDEDLHKFDHSRGGQQWADDDVEKLVES